jgi:hypothetical protein
MNEALPGRKIPQEVLNSEPVRYKTLIAKGKTPTKIS